jgi:hypothetical protein
MSESEWVGWTTVRRQSNRTRREGGGATRERRRARARMTSRRAKASKSEAVAKKTNTASTGPASGNIDALRGRRRSEGKKQRCREGGGGFYRSSASCVREQQQQHKHAGRASPSRWATLLHTHSCPTTGIATQCHLLSHAAGQKNVTCLLLAPLDHAHVPRR